MDAVFHYEHKQASPGVDFAEQTNKHTTTI